MENTPLDYGRVAHLRIDIYPPHVRRPMKWDTPGDTIQDLCSGLQETSCVHQLSIHFFENQYAMWSTAGEPGETLDMAYDSDMVHSDLPPIMDLFRLLTNLPIQICTCLLHLVANLKLQAVY